VYVADIRLMGRMLHLKQLKYFMSISTTPEYTQPRLQIQQLLDNTQPDDGTAIVQGLQQPQKSLPPRYFYDDRGSQLFEQICQLPEYYPTRTEAAILTQYAPDIARMTGACELIELGSGSSTKTRILLDAYKALGYPLRYVPNDVSAGILKDSAADLLTTYPTLQIEGIVGTYEQALDHLQPTTLPGRMVIFLGSTLGNFSSAECDQFYAHLARAVAPGEYFLLGIDLQKPPAVLEAAYNDAQGITAAFNLNCLKHLNWRFGSNFNLDWFEHFAVYNPNPGQIEMHLRCLEPHTVTFDHLDFTATFEAGETIHTEVSRKFDLQEIQTYLQQQGLTPLKVWTDSQSWFGMILCQREGEGKREEEWGN
jgi:L-histidine N-alpha-methyltransferase